MDGLRQAIHLYHSSSYLSGGQATMRDCIISVIRQQSPAAAEEKEVKDYLPPGRVPRTPAEGLAALLHLPPGRWIFPTRKSEIAHLLRKRHYFLEVRQEAR